MQPTDNNKNLILFVVMSFGILLLWAQLFPPPKPPKRPRSATSQPTTRLAYKSRPTLAKATSRPSLSAASQPTASQPAASASLPTAPASAIKDQEIERKDKLFAFRISNRGGAITSFKTKQFRDPAVRTQRVPLQLVAPEVAKEAPFHERFLHDSIRKQIDPRYLTSAGAIRYERLSFQGKDVVLHAKLPLKQGGYLFVEKQILFKEKSYAQNIRYRIRNASQSSLQTALGFYLTDYVDPKKLQSGGLFSGPGDSFDGVCKQGSEKQPLRHTRDDLAKKPFTLKGEINYVGIDRRYFMMAWVPTPKEAKAIVQCDLQHDPRGWIVASLQHRGQKLSPNEEIQLEMTAFIGPKFYQSLSQVGGQLESAIDFGFFAFLSKPMLWLMQFFYNNVFMNWGVAIILLTLFVKILLWIPTEKQMVGMKKMSKLGPEMERIKKKYGDDKESIQRETMALYSREGVNPFASCLPMLIQMPIWLALYNTLFSAVELYQAPFVPRWIEDLSVSDPFFILPLVLGASMFLQQKMSPTTGMDETQAKMMKTFMPIFFTVIMLFLPAGLTLYIFINTIVGIFHQWLVYRRPEEVVIDAKKQPKKVSWMEKMSAYVEEQQKEAAKRNAANAKNPDQPKKTPPKKKS